jgi:hypothetical protein
MAVSAALLLVSAGAALSQPRAITSEEEANAYSILTRAPIRSPLPPDLELGPGAIVPPAVELQPVPDSVPVVRGYQYTVHSDRVYIVDPDSRQVIRVIPSR